MSEDSIFDSVDSSEEVGQNSGDASATEDVKKSKFNVWDTMLLVSLVCVAVACMLLVFELRNFSNFPFSFPWNTSEAIME